MTAWAEEEEVKAPDIKIEFPKEPALQKFLEGYKADVVQEITDAFNEAKAEGGIYNPWSLDLNARVTYKGRFWALAFNGYDYRGGAHGVPYLDVVYFSEGGGKQIAQADLLAPDALKKLAEWCRADLVKQGFEANDEWMLKGTEPKAGNYKLIIPEEKGVEVVFNAYQVAPYAAGEPSVTIPWNKAKELFVEKYRP